jgi:hypothetical protein
MQESVVPGRPGDGLQEASSQSLLLKPTRRRLQMTRGMMIWSRISTRLYASSQTAGLYIDIMQPQLIAVTVGSRSASTLIIIGPEGRISKDRAGRAIRAKRLTCIEAVGSSAKAGEDTESRKLRPDTIASLEALPCFPAPTIRRSSAGKYCYKNQVRVAGLTAIEA